MLVDDAKKLAAAIEEAINSGSVAQGITTTIKTDQMQPQSIPAGAGRPTFIRYYIQVDDGTRMATLNLGQAGGLLDEIEPDWGPDRLFDAIRARDVPVEDSPVEDSPVDNSNVDNSHVDNSN